MYKSCSRSLQHAIDKQKETSLELEAKRRPKGVEVPCRAGGDLLEVGRCVSGRVKKVMPCGVVLTLDDVEGFIHISEISDSWVRHPSEYFAVGDSVKAQVILIDMAKNQVRLSLKAKRHR
ncbi:S1 RNA-binding domain-containing protein [Geomonas propionica]|uniref:S1 RNA-binding domain-containing protein n=1 Tax=Geomonas propionica TaxID=2798582 RepID=A0ABS0YP52_9BACT|nr:S1 RNA-binding domain-containing protein [Geomonas propionica]